MNRVSAMMPVGHTMSFNLNALPLGKGSHHISAFPVGNGVELLNWDSPNGTFDLRCERPGIYIFVISTDNGHDNRRDHVFMVTAQGEEVATMYNVQCTMYSVTSLIDGIKWFVALPSS